MGEVLLVVFLFNVWGNSGPERLGILPNVIQRGSDRVRIYYQVLGFQSRQGPRIYSGVKSQGPKVEMVTFEEITIFRDKNMRCFWIYQIKMKPHQRTAFTCPINCLFMLLPFSWISKWSFRTLKREKNTCRRVIVNPEPILTLHILLASVQAGMWLGTCNWYATAQPCRESSSQQDAVHGWADFYPNDKLITLTKLDIL